MTGQGGDAAGFHEVGMSGNGLRAKRGTMAHQATPLNDSCAVFQRDDASESMYAYHICI